MSNIVIIEVIVKLILSVLENNNSENLNVSHLLHKIENLQTRDKWLKLFMSLIRFSLSFFQMQIYVPIVHKLNFQSEYCPFSRLLCMFIQKYIEMYFFFIGKYGTSFYLQNVKFIED